MGCFGVDDLNSLIRKFVMVFDDVVLVFVWIRVFFVLLRVESEIVSEIRSEVVMMVLMVSGR